MKVWSVTGCVHYITVVLYFKNKPTPKDVEIAFINWMNGATMDKQCQAILDELLSRTPTDNVVIMEN